MFPLNDFNFVACAIATFSAAIGYNFSRRRAGRRRDMDRASSDIGSKLHLRRRERSISSVSSDTATLVDSDESFTFDSPTLSYVGVDLTEPGSLKRKNRNEDINDSVMPSANEARRLTTPQRKRHRSMPLQYECPELGPIKSEGAEDTEFPPVVMAPNQTPILNVKPLPAFVHQAPSSPANPKPIASAFSIPVCRPSSAFAAFAGTSSSLASASIATNGLQRPIWCGESAERTDGTSIPVRPGVNPTGNVADNAEGLSEPTKSSGSNEPSLNSVENPLAALAASATANPQQNSTGEEEEDAHGELKGVKLFIKRGDKDFSNGILGHVKFLTHRDTSDERLVFRRESVWKVSMSVRLRPEVRCTFDEDQSILRVVHKEAVGVEISEISSEQVVVYALTRGKVAKAEFTEFARSIVSSTRLSDNSFSTPSTE